MSARSRAPGIQLKESNKPLAIGSIFYKPRFHPLGDNRVHPGIEGDHRMDADTIVIPQEPQPSTAPRRAAVLFILITVTLDMLAMGMIAPVLPRLVTQFLGGNQTRAAEMYGIFATVWALGQFFFSPVLGSRVKQTPVPEFSPRLPKTIWTTFTAVPSRPVIFSTRR